jgi:hypothetical protein
VNGGETRAVSAGFVLTVLIAAVIVAFGGPVYRARARS